MHVSTLAYGMLPCAPSRGGGGGDSDGGDGGGAGGGGCDGEGGGGGDGGGGEGNRGGAKERLLVVIRTPRGEGAATELAMELALRVTARAPPSHNWT